VNQLTDAHAIVTEAASIIARFTDADQDSATAIDGFFLSHRTSASAPLHTAQWPCLALVFQGEKRIEVGADGLDYGVGRYLVVSMELPVISRVTLASRRKPLLGIGMAIHEERLRSVMRRCRLDVLPPAARQAPTVTVASAPTAMLDAVLRLLRLLDEPSAIGALAPLIEEEILFRVLMGPAGPRLASLFQADSASHRISKATRWLRENFAASLRVQELAASVGMSVSSLHHHFQDVAGMTPLQYQKLLRLHEARRLMLVERLEAGSAGHAVGYQSASQFSREYGRLYGRPPARDIDAIRKAADRRT
jgi:AraC-like DNA-binding protein